jgi:hypothetical protein
MKRLLTLLFVALVGASMSAQWAASGNVPAYNAAPPPAEAKLPTILSGKQLQGSDFQHPSQVRAYQLAAKMDKVLYQLPCYCYCDRSQGHNSLRSCFESEHAARCGICLQEAFYAYQKHKAGWTVRQIREGIRRGEYKKINLETAYKIK